MGGGFYFTQWRQNAEPPSKYMVQRPCLELGWALIWHALRALVVRSVCDVVCYLTLTGVPLLELDCRLVNAVLFVKHVLDKNGRGRRNGRRLAGSCGCGAAVLESG